MHLKTALRTYEAHSLTGRVLIHHWERTMKDVLLQGPGRNNHTFLKLKFRGGSMYHRLVRGHEIIKATQVIINRRQWMRVINTPASTSTESRLTVSWWWVNTCCLSIWPDTCNEEEECVGWRDEERLLSQVKIKRKDNNYYKWYVLLRSREACVLWIIIE